MSKKRIKFIYKVKVLNKTHFSVWLVQIWLNINKRIPCIKFKKNENQTPKCFVNSSGFGILTVYILRIKLVLSSVRVILRYEKLYFDKLSRAIENHITTKILLLDTNFSHFQSKNSLELTNFLKIRNWLFYKKHE